MNQEKIWHYHQNKEESVSVFKGSVKRYQFIAQNVPVHSKVLNIGVGNGGLEKILACRNDVYCIDPDQETINTIKKQLGLGDKAVCGYSQSIPYEDNFFDIIIMTEVLEHLEDTCLYDTIDEVYRVLRSGGKFIGTVPADEQLEQQEVICPKCGEIFHRWGHEQSFDKEKLYNTLNNRFDVIKIQRKSFVLWDSLNIKGKIMYLIKKVSLFFRIKGSGENFFFSATKI